MIIEEGAIPGAYVGAVRNSQTYLVMAHDAAGLDDLGQTHLLSRRGMKKLNKRGVFHNTEDTLPDLEAALKENFKEYDLYTIGAIAFFPGKV